LVALGVSACANVIGLSDYQIDGSLGVEDGGDNGKAGSLNTGARAGSGMGGAAPVGGTMADSGTGPVGGSQAMVGGAAGGGGEGGELGCSDDRDCDDDVPCTVDRCDGALGCVNQPDHTLCDADPGECLKCERAIGCVPGETENLELLEDRNFDEMTGVWEEYSEQNGINIFEDPAAQTPPNSAWFFGYDPTEQEYADLLQNITIPQNTVGLRLSGFYDFSPGSQAPADDYIVAAIYEIGEITPSVRFHTWEGIHPAPPLLWNAFNYDASMADLRAVLGLNVTFDLVAYSWDSSWYFDSLSLQATLCLP
jgi:hypothetical protein